MEKIPWEKLSSLEVHELMNADNISSSVRGYYLTMWLRYVHCQEKTDRGFEVYKMPVYRACDFLQEANYMKHIEDFGDDREIYWYTLDDDHPSAIKSWGDRWVHVGNNIRHVPHDLYYRLNVPILPKLFAQTIEALREEKHRGATQVVQKLKKMTKVWERISEEMGESLEDGSIWQSVNGRGAIYLITEFCKEKKKYRLQTEKGAISYKTKYQCLKSFRRLPDIVPKYTKGTLLRAKESQDSICEVVDHNNLDLYQIREKRTDALVWRTASLLDKAYVKVKYPIGTRLALKAVASVTFRVIGIDGEKYLLAKYDGTEYLRTEEEISKAFMILPPGIPLKESGPVDCLGNTTSENTSPVDCLSNTTSENTIPVHSDTADFYEKIEEITIMSKLQNTANKVIETNKLAALNTAKIGVGQAANKAAVKLIKGKLPIVVRGYAEEPIGKLVTANLVNFAVQQYVGDNEKAVLVADAMVNAAMIDMLSDFDIDSFVEEFMDSVPTGKMNKFMKAHKDVIDVDVEEE